MGVFNNERKEIKMSLNVDFKNCPNAFEECEPDYTPDCFFDTATPEIYTLSVHDALPI